MREVEVQPGKATRPGRAAVQGRDGGAVEDGRVDELLKVLAVTGRKRSSVLPQVPTLKEAGIAFDTEIWFGLFAPGRLPEAEAQKIAQAAERALRKPEVTARIKELGMEADPITRAGFDKEWRADMVTWARLVKQSGATAD